MREFVRRASSALVTCALIAACGSARTGASGALEPRFLAVHNALSAVGLAQIGPIAEGRLGEKREARVLVALPAGCVTLVAIAGEGIRDLDATLLDPAGRALAHDTTAEPQAVLHTCVESAASYVLVVRAAAGSGSWVSSAWVGGVGAPSGSAEPRAVPEANGTCSAPIPLASGTVSGSTKRGEHEANGSCQGPGDARELVYELDVPRRERAILELEAGFDSVLYLRKDDCESATAEVDCNDDAADRMHSRIDRVLEPGKYFVFVDGYGHEAGSFTMTVATTELVALAELCREAPLLLSGVAASGSTLGRGDDAEATCAGGAPGADLAYIAELPARQRVRVTERSDEFTPVLHLRRACTDSDSEVSCGEAGAMPGEATVTGVFDPGTYAVFADAHQREAGGRFTLLWETAPETGSGALSDSCGEAETLGASSVRARGTVLGDTFTARDDVAASCGGAGAADVVYRVNVARPSRLLASLEGEESHHLLALFRRCGDRGTELACGLSLREVLSPGSFFLTVDGASPDAIGKFKLDWALRDLTGQRAACASAPLLAPGHTDGTTLGAGDKFLGECGSAAASGPDRVYRIALAAAARIRIALTAPTFDAVLILRKACGDFPEAPLQELACELDTAGNHRTNIERELEAGGYWVVVDGQSTNDGGAFTLDYRVIH